MQYTRLGATGLSASRFCRGRQIRRHDPDTATGEMLAALGHLVRAGEACSLGASAKYAWPAVEEPYRPPAVRGP